MERHELRFTTRAALARAFGELARSPFVESCHVDLGQRLIRFTARPGSSKRLPYGFRGQAPPGGARSEPEANGEGWAGFARPGPQD